MNNLTISKQIEAAIILPVQEVELLVSDFRRRYDPLASVGVPAHITINYPFTPHINRPKKAGADLLVLISEFSQFYYNLTEIRTFDQVVYLFPEPTEPFISLIKAIFTRFPDSPPYKGEFTQPIPHLTVAQVEKDEILQVKEELTKRLGSLLPLPAKARELWLIDNSEKIWKRRQVFPLKSF